MGDIIQGAPL